MWLRTHKPPGSDEIYSITEHKRNVSQNVVVHYFTKARKLADEIPVVRRDGRNQVKLNVSHWQILRIHHHK